MAIDMDIDPDKQRTLRNWVGDGVITHADAKQLIDDGKVPKGKENQTLVKYSSLKQWGY